MYRQLIDRILMAIAHGVLKPGDQLPTVRELAVSLEINPNTVMRAYRELEIRRVLTTQQGVGTYVSSEPVQVDKDAREKRLTQLTVEFVSRAAAEGYRSAEIEAHVRAVLGEKAPR